MPEALLCLCTCPDAASARRLAGLLGEARLAACVNILPGLTSVYRWQGAVETADEVLLVIKTDAAHYPALEETLQRGGGMSRVWMIGHNPGMQQLALHFDRDGDYHGMPTAAIAVVTPATPGARLADGMDWRVRRWAP